MSLQRAEIDRQVKAIQDEQIRLGNEQTRLDKARGPYDVAAVERLKAIDKRFRETSSELKVLALQSRKLDDEETALAQQAAAILHQARREDRSFWFRRFHTSLALAHGAGFAAVSSKLFDPALKAATAGYAFYPMGAFAVGMVLAGLIPVALYRDAGRWAWALAGTSAVLFCGALAASLIAVWRQTGWPFP